MTVNEAANLVDSCYNTCEPNLPPELESKIKQIQLDAMREGMRRAADIVKTHEPERTEVGYRKAILTASEQLTEKDL